MTYGKLGILSGGGELPKILVDACLEADKPFHVLAIDGACGLAWLQKLPHHVIQMGTLKRTRSILEDEGCDAIVMVGRVARPNFANLKVDMLGAKLLPKVVLAARNGDDALLRVLVDQFEAFGFTVLGADDVVESLLIGGECLTKSQPNDAQQADIEKAFNAAKELGRLDIGQAAVVCRGVVLAVEAAEGTDQMLRRCAALPENVRGTVGARDGVLVKVKKPNQERRTDLPVIGVETVDRAADAGLAGIALEAGNALVLNRKRVAERADALNLFVVGVNRGAGR